MLVLVSVVTSSGLTTVLGATASAATVPNAAIAASLDSEIASLSYRETLNDCIHSFMNQDIQLNASDNQEAPPSKWFVNQNGESGYIYPDGKTDCSAIAPKALALWGYSNQPFLQALGYTYSKSTAQWNGPDGNTRSKNFQAAVNLFVYGVHNTDTPVLSDAAKYVMALHYFTDPAGSCKAKDFGTYESISSGSSKNPTLDSWLTANNGEGTSFDASLPGSHVDGIDTGSVTYQKVTVINSAKNSEVHGYAYNSNNSQTISTGQGGIATAGGATVVQEYGPLDHPTQRACADLVNDITNYAPAYRAWLNLPQNSNTPPATAGGKVDCAATNSCSTGPPTSSCPVEGIGWIVCPVLNAIGGLDDAMWTLTSTLLTVSPLQQNQTDNNGAVVLDSHGDPVPSAAYSIWKTLWSITNVGFVIVFLVLIFSQLSGIGLSNYGVKKMLPRFVVAVLIAALSFPLIQIAVDTSNIAGKSIYDLFGSVANNTPLPTWSGGTESLITLIVAGGLTGVIGAAIGPGAALMIILPIALAAVLGFLAALITLIFRQALIPILAVIAPIAILAYVLPNTQKWFDKWWGMFLSMLMLFPLAALLFGGVKLAAYMINSGGSAWSKLIALIVMSIPLFALPFIARQAGPILSKVQSAAKGLGAQIQKPVSTWAGKQRAAGLARADASTPGKLNIGRRIRHAAVRSGRRRDVKTAAYQAQSTAEFNRDLAGSDTWAKNVRGADAQAFIRGARSKAEAEELKAAQIPLEDEVAQIRSGTHSNSAYAGMGVDDFLKHRATDTTRSGTEREAALHKAASLGRDGVIRDLRDRRDAAGRPVVHPEAVQRAIGANAGALAGKAPDLVKGATAFDGFTGKDMSQWSEGTAKAFMDHIRGLNTAANTAGVNKALADFASAATDIQRNPNLQGEFSARAGSTFTAQAAVLNGTPGLAGISSAFGAIGADGKIR